MIGNLLPYQILAAVGRCGVQEAWRRSGELLAQCGTARFPIPRPERHPVRQRCAAAGATRARGHPGSSRSGRRTRIAMLVRATGGDVAAAGQPDAVCRHRPESRPVRRQWSVSRTARCALVAGQPERSAPDTGRAGCRTSRGSGSERAGHARTAAAECAAGSQAGRACSRQAHLRRHRRSHPPCHPGRQHRQVRARSYQFHSSHPAGTGGSGR